MKVFIVQHVRVVQDDQEDVKLIGVYSSEELARSVVARLSKAKGFIESADAFNVDAYELDKDYWTEGFIKVR